VALALTLALRLIVAAPDDCYVVTNTRTLVVPCDIGPAAIDELTEEPPPSKAATVQLGSAGQAGRRNRPSPRVQPVAPLGHQELERRLQTTEDRRITAVAERLEAELARDRALEQRDATLHEIARLRQELAAARAHLEQGRCTASR
jgi:hypothetical protein